MSVVSKYPTTCIKKKQVKEIVVILHENTGKRANEEYQAAKIEVGERKMFFDIFYEEMERR